MSCESETLENSEEPIELSKFLDNYLIEDYIFSSNFDSGNLGRVEFVRKYLNTEISERIIHFEFNVWTTPDCYGTPYETPNRTWFYFSIKGGRPYRNVKINVKNLNRQAKLFHQGMQPVMRIGENGKWERIREKPAFSTENENFTISFIHRSTDIPHVEHFYAFTYPFSYSDSQNMLNKFDFKFQKRDVDIMCIIKRLEDYNNETKKHHDKTKEGTSCCKEEGNIKLGDEGDNAMKKDDATSTLAHYDPFGYDANRNLEAFEIQSIYERINPKSLLTDIYYHRELLVRSLEGRRVDLLTITSFHGIEMRREERLSTLFPEKDTLRCHTFKNKKIIFLSSRVHPGETPASFVLNGFLNLILDKNNMIAATLRQLYVFKIVPMLNPDGVFRGHYRTDTLGQNLNRMYIAPTLEKHPAIYAVKKIIKAYHFGFENIDTEHPDSETYITSGDFKSDSSSSSLIEEHVFAPGQKISKSSICKKAKKTEEINNEVATEEKSKEGKASEDSDQRRSSDSYRSAKDMSSSSDVEDSSTTNKSGLKNSSDNKKSFKSSSRKVLSNASNTSSIKNNEKGGERKHSQKSIPTIIRGGTSPRGSNIIRKNIQIIGQGGCATIDFSRSEEFVHRNCISDKSNLFLYIDFHGHASKKGVFMYGNHFSNSFEAVECMMLPRLMGMNCHHFHYDACNFSEKNMYRTEKRDGLSKEGSGRVAVYKMTGLIKSYTLESNYNTGKYVNVLPARGKENPRKTGLPKPLVSKSTPPKYTPAIYEEVGRALGPSILDISNSNSLTRIHNSDFRTILGLRITLRAEIERNNNAVRPVAVPPTVTGAPHHQSSAVPSAYPSGKGASKGRKRNTLQVSVMQQHQDETAKENKCNYSLIRKNDTNIYPGIGSSSTIPGNGAVSLPSTSNYQFHYKAKQNMNKMSSSASKLLIKKKVSKPTLKKTTLKVRSSIFFSSKDSLISNASKKKSKMFTNETSHQLKSKEHQIFHVPHKKIRIASSSTSTPSTSTSMCVATKKPVTGGVSNNRSIVKHSQTAAASNTMLVKVSRSYDHHHGNNNNSNNNNSGGTAISSTTSADISNKLIASSLGKQINTLIFKQMEEARTLAAKARSNVGGTPFMVEPPLHVFSGNAEEIIPQVAPLLIGRAINPNNLNNNCNNNNNNHYTNNNNNNNKTGFSREKNINFPAFLKCEELNCTREGCPVAVSPSTANVLCASTINISSAVIGISNVTTDAAVTAAVAAIPTMTTTTATTAISPNSIADNVPICIASGNSDPMISPHQQLNMVATTSTAANTEEESIVPCCSRKISSIRNSQYVQAAVVASTGCNNNNNNNRNTSSNSNNNNSANISLISTAKNVHKIKKIRTIKKTVHSATTTITTSSSAQQHKISAANTGNTVKMNDEHHLPGTSAFSSNNNNMKTRKSLNDTSENTRLSKKKRIIRHDTIAIKRRRNKFKKSLHH